MILRCPLCRTNVPTADVTPSATAPFVVLTICPKCDATLTITITVRSAGDSR